MMMKSQVSSERSNVSLSRKQLVAISASASAIHRDLSISKFQTSNSGNRRNIQPVLNRGQRNRSKQNSQTAASKKDAFLNADVQNLLDLSKKKRGHHTRNASALTQSQQANAASMGVKQFSKPQPPEAEWNSGIRKLMSKVHELNQDKAMYLSGPVRSQSSTPNNQSAVIRKGKMVFGRPKGESRDWRPSVETYLAQSSPHAPFAFHPEQNRLSQLHVTPSTAPHLKEAVQLVNMQGETSQQFEYLVNKTILKDENKDISSQANRLNKLNALCKKTNKDVIQIRKECRMGNYEIDPAVLSRNKALAKSVDPTEAYTDAKMRSSTTFQGPKRGQASNKPIQILTPLDAITAGIDLLYKMDKNNFQQETEQMQYNSDGQDEEIQLPQIDAGFQVASSGGGDPYSLWSQRHQALRAEYRGKARGRVRSGSPKQSDAQASSPTTMSKSYLSRGAMSQSKNMAARCKRVQSAINKRSRKITYGPDPAPIDQEDYPNDDSKNDQAQNESKPFEISRRAQSAIFKPLSAVGHSGAKFDNVSGNLPLSNIRSSHQILAQRPESSVGTGANANQMSAEQMMKMLNQHFEQKLSEKPDALQSEGERKNVIQNAIMKIFNKNKQMVKPVAAPNEEVQPEQEDPQAKLDNLIQLQKQTTKLESISESNKNVQVSQEELVDDSVVKTKSHQQTQQSSILTDQLSIKESIKKQPQQPKSSQIQVQVTDVEAEGQIQESNHNEEQPSEIKTPPQLRHFKSSYDKVRTQFTSKIDDYTKGKTLLSKTKSQMSVLKEEPIKSTTPQPPSKSIKHDDRITTIGAVSIGAKSLNQRTEDINRVSLKTLPKSGTATLQEPEKQASIGMPEHTMAISQNMMFGAKDEDEYYDDDDYAFKKQRKAKEESKKLTALAYDTGKCKNQILTSPLEPVLRQQGRPASTSLSRATKLVLQDSAKADQRLTELYRTTIEDFKKKLIKQKQEVMLSRVNAQFKAPPEIIKPEVLEVVVPRKLTFDKKSKSKPKKRHTSAIASKKKESQQLVCLSVNRSDADKISARSSNHSHLGTPSRKNSRRSSVQSVRKSSVKLLTPQSKSKSKSGSFASNSSSQSLRISNLEGKGASSERKAESCIELKVEETPKIKFEIDENNLPTPMEGIKKVMSMGHQTAKLSRKMTIAYDKKLKKRKTLNHRQLSRIAEGGETTDGGPTSSQHLPINIKIQKPATKHEKKTKKLLDIIKGYETQKLKQKLSDEEVDFIDLIDEIKTKVDESRPYSRVNQLLGLGPIRSTTLDENKLSMINGILSISGANSPVNESQPAQPTEADKRLKHSVPLVSGKVHHTKNIDCKTLFYFHEQDRYAEKTQEIAKRSLKRNLEAQGDFENLYEPLDLVKRGEVADDHCLLSHPAYEYDHGFRINNVFTHGHNLKRESKIEDNCRQLHDLRLTRSEPDLQKYFLYKHDDESSQDRRDGEGDSAEQLKYLRPSKDDLEMFLDTKNLDLFHTNRADDQLERVKNVANQPDRDQKEFMKKVTATSQGQIVNLHKAECDLMVREGLKFEKFEQQLDEIINADLIKCIENMGQIPNSNVVSREEILSLEKEFYKQDDQVPKVSSLIEHIDNLELVQFNRVTEDTPQDASVEIQRFGLSKVPVKLELKKVIGKEQEVPVQLLWLLKIDDLLKEAIANVFKSPFNPAPILENFKMEFNIVNIPPFRKYLRTLRSTEVVKLPYEFQFYRSKLMKGAMQFFNDKVVDRKEQQISLTIRFSHPMMKKINQENMLYEGKFFKPDWHIANAEDLQKFKISRGMPDVVEARRENQMELYVSHDIGSVKNHFYQPAESAADYNHCVQKILAYNINQAEQGDRSIDYPSDSSEDDLGPTLDPDLVDSDNSFTTSGAYLKQLKSSPDKAQIRSKRPQTLINFQKPICRELEPTKIRLNTGPYTNGENQAILIIEQSGSYNRIVRMPDRLHEQYCHMWGFRGQIFAEPRPDPYSVHHEIIPEGQSANDFSNKDFCFYDIIVPERTPEAQRARQAELREQLDRKLHALQSRKEIQTIKESSQRSMASVQKSVKASSKRPKVNVRVTLDTENERESSPDLKLNLAEPQMKKSNLQKKKASKKKGKKPNKLTSHATTQKIISSRRRSSSDDSKGRAISILRPKSPTTALHKAKTSFNAALLFPDDASVDSKSSAGSRSNSKRRANKRRKSGLSLSQFSQQNRHK